MEKEKREDHNHHHGSSHLSRDERELEKIKNEILQEIAPRKNKKQLSWGGALVTSILIILTFVSVGQAFQSFNILKKIEGGAISSVNASNSAPLPSSLKDLPNMVGGC